MAKEPGLDEKKLDQKRALLLEYLEKADNKIEKRVEKVDSPVRSMEGKEEDKSSVNKTAVVSPIVLVKEGESVPFFIKASAKLKPVDQEKLKFFRDKRLLLEKVLEGAPAVATESTNEQAVAPIQASSALPKTKTKAKAIDLDNQQQKEKIAVKLPPVLIKDHSSSTSASSLNIAKFWDGSLERLLKISAMVFSEPELAAPKTAKPVKKKIKSKPKSKSKPNSVVGGGQAQAKALAHGFKSFSPRLSSYWLQRLKKDIHRKSTRRLGRNLKEWFYGSLFFAGGFYLAYLLLIYNFKPNNWIFSQLNRLLPAPAIISSFGLVDFQTYQELKAMIDRTSAIDDPAFMALRWQAITLLASHYGLDASLDQDLLLEALKRKVISDPSLNFDASVKYNNLKVSLRSQNSLRALAAENGLAVERRGYSKKLAADSFGNLIYSLPLNTLSPIIINDRGLYVISPIAVSETKIEMELVFVPALTLSQLVDMEISDAWLINLLK
jgi:hypothetical protein